MLGELGSLGRVVRWSSHGASHTRPRRTMRLRTWLVFFWGHAVQGARLQLRFCVLRFWSKPPFFEAAQHTPGGHMEPLGK